MIRKILILWVFLLLVVIVQCSVHFKTATPTKQCTAAVPQITSCESCLNSTSSMLWCTSPAFCFSEGNTVCSDDCNGEIKSSKDINAQGTCSKVAKNKSSAWLLIILVFIVCLCPCCAYGVVAGLFNLGFVITLKGIRRRPNFVPLALASRVVPNPSASFTPIVVVGDVVVVDNSEVDVEMESFGTSAVCAEAVE